jgi:hypothetical protein
VNARPSSAAETGLPSWMAEFVPTVVGFVPKVMTSLVFADMVGAWRVRWGIGRMNYRVDPGLYAVGNPDPYSPVLVSANYKLSFDSLRKNLEAINAWILVLDTKGVNVWCSAGKGTFGTEELIKRVRLANIASLVKHRTIIVPQLAGPGVAAYIVARETAFKVVYGPVRARDLPCFFENALKADRSMRTVTFPIMERLAVVPIELVQSWKIALGALAYHAVHSAVYGRLLWRTA